MNESPIHSIAACRGERPRRILLLVLLPIGDTLFTLPTLRALRERYPTAHLTALVHSETAPVLARVPDLDDVVTLPLGADWMGPRPLLETLSRLRAVRFDVAIDLTSPAYKWISLLCGVPRRTYMKFDPFWWWLPRRHERWRATHAARHYYDCARELDLAPWEQTRRAPVLSLAGAERDEARRCLATHGALGAPEPLVALHAGGDWLGGLKQWPPARFAALARRLEQERGGRIVLLGGPEERALAERIAAGLRAPIVAAGELPLLTSLAVIEASALFVGDDSGLLHAAAALGTPYVGIYGPTWPPNFRPLPRWPGQGLLVTPATSCRSPRYFVGGDVVWSRPCCRGTCRALCTIDVETVLARALTLLPGRPSVLRAQVGSDVLGAPGKRVGTEQADTLRSSSIKTGR